MGIKNELKALAAEKVSALISSEGIDDAIYSVFNKLGKAAGITPTDDLTKKVEKNCLVVKARLPSLGTLLDLFSDEEVESVDKTGKYLVVDTDGKILYRVDAEETVIDREILDLFNASEERIGCIKEHILPMGVPIFERDVKKCSVFWGKDKLCVLKKSVSFGEVEFEVLEGDVKIIHKKGQEIILYYCGREIALLHEVRMTLKNGYADRFIVESSSKESEAMGILLTIAIALIKS